MKLSLPASIPWFYSSSCNPPYPFHPYQTPYLQWLIFLLFSPCPQHLLSSSLSLLFLLALLLSPSSSLLHRPLPLSFSSRRRRPPPSASFLATLLLVSASSLASLAVAAWQLRAVSLLGWRGRFAPLVVFWILRALSWLACVVVLVFELKNDAGVHPRPLRAWWFASSFLALFACVAAVIRFARMGLSYDAFLRVDDVLAVATFPVSLLLLVASTRGGTGLASDPKASENGLAEPLLNGGEKEAVPRGPVTGYANASLFSRAIFLWLNPILSLGYKRALNTDDVPALAPLDQAQYLYEFFRSNWPKSATDRPVRKTLLKCFLGPLALTGFMALVRTLAMYVGPVLIQSFVDFLNSDKAYIYQGYFLVFILFVGKCVELLATHQYNFLSQRLGMRLRSSLITSIYQKGLRLSTSARQAHGVGQIVNYMSVDVMQISDSIVQLHNVWILPLQILLSLAILYGEIGISMLAGLATLTICGSCVSVSGRFISKFSQRMMMSKDGRMKETTEALNSMKIIKLQAWEDHFRKRIESSRAVEYSWLMKFTIALQANVFMLTVSTSVVCVVTFGTCLLLGVNLTVGKIFTAISTFNILAEPIRTFPQAILSISQALVSLERIDRFMVSKELDEYVVHGTAASSGNAAVIDRGCFIWDEEEKKPVLHDIDLVIRQGAYVAIVGTVGSGKSSLLAALLGEMPKLSGTVKLFGSTAYVPQSAWIQNGTIEQNILFGAAMDPARYRRVIKVCALEVDLSLFEYGDQTEIGERGINLSGGQKQRIQLARAVYQDSEIYLLDDIFSAVDAQTGSDLFKECVLGVLGNKTRILVTHQLDFLHAADLILVMQDGMIVQSGKYNELLGHGTKFATLVAAHKEALGTMGADVKTMAEEVAETNTGKRKEVLEDGDKISKHASSGSLRPRVRAESKFIEEEQRETGRVGWNVYWRFLSKAYGWSFPLLVVLTQIIAQGFSIFSDFWLADETSKTTAFSPVFFMRNYTLLCAGSWVFTLLRCVLSAMFGVKTAQTFYSAMLQSIFRAPMSFFDTTPTGRILTRSSTDQITIDLLLPFFFGIGMGLYMAVVGAVIVTCEVTWPIVFVVLPLGWIYLWYQAFFLTSSRELTRLDSIMKAPVIHHFTETISGFHIIRAYRQKERFALTNLNRVDNNLKLTFHYDATNEWLGFRLDMIGAVVLCVAALLIVVLPASVVKPEFAALSLSYGLSLNALLAGSIFFSCAIENRMVSVERVEQFSRLPEEAPLVIKGCLPSAKWPHKGNISLRDLKARYQPNSPLVLKGISLNIAGGQKIGVVGRTGGGKSTLIQAFFRIIEPWSGQILIDDVDITSLGLHDLRSKLAIIPQEPVLFHGTVRLNLDPLGVHTDQEVWEALRKCQLADMIDEKREKLDAEVKEYGENWSVGQRQLLCLGRALLKESRILFLDEATASVDSQTDVVLQKIIREEFKLSTVVSIAHRIPTVMDCDRVMVLDAGYLKEYDSPVKLLEQPASLFSSLVHEYTARSGY